MEKWMLVESNLKLSQLEDIDPTYPPHMWPLSDTNPFFKVSDIDYKIGTRSHLIKVRSRANYMRNLKNSTKIFQPRCF